MGALGRGEGIAALATALVTKEEARARRSARPPAHEPDLRSQPRPRGARRRHAALRPAARRQGPARQAPLPRPSGAPHASASPCASRCARRSTGWPAACPTRGSSRSSPRSPSSRCRRCSTRSTAPALLVVLDGVEDPRNLGAILRTAEAAGADGVLLPERHSAGLSETVARASAGALEHVTVARVGNLVQALKALKERGVWIVGYDAAGTERWDAVDLTKPVALVLGGEGRGIRRLVREHCDHLVSIPHFGHVTSLNVSVAAGVALYEAVRQRGAVPSVVRPIPARPPGQIIGPGPDDDLGEDGVVRGRPPRERGDGSSATARTASTARRSRTSTSTRTSRGAAGRRSSRRSTSTPRAAPATATGTAARQGQARAAATAGRPAARRGARRPRRPCRARRPHGARREAGRRPSRQRRTSRRAGARGRGGVATRRRRRRASGAAAGPATSATPPRTSRRRAWSTGASTRRCAGTARDAERPAQAGSGPPRHGGAGEGAPPRTAAARRPGDGAGVAAIAEAGLAGGLARLPPGRWYRLAPPGPVC